MFERLANLILSNENLPILFLDGKEVEANLSKRTETLAQMLWVRSVLSRFWGDTPTKENLIELLGTSEGRRAVAIIVRKAKADRVGVALADISVCGVLPPYNEILGGKLISMVLTSPEVIAAYHERYKETRSIIASSMAGRLIVRSPRLVCLTTTSLYGTCPSQYNRLVLPCEKVGGKPGEQIRYIHWERREDLEQDSLVR